MGEILHESADSGMTLVEPAAVQLHLLVQDQCAGYHNTRVKVQRPHQHSYNRNGHTGLTDVIVGGWRQPAQRRSVFVVSGIMFWYHISGFH